MKPLYLAIALLAACTLIAPCCQAQGEIIIEMRGEDASPAPSVWEYNAIELTRKLRGKTREQVLYAMPVVSNKDRIIRSEQQEYALVEYYDGDHFRKFLFKAETPQTFIAAAATAADVLAVNKKYGINMGLTQRSFENFYADKAVSETADILPSGAVLYRLLYTDINTPVPVQRWFLFENKELTQTFETLQEKDNYLASLQPQPQPSTASATPQNHSKRTLRKALISGGTQWDQAYLPRVVNPQPLLSTPKLSQTQTP